MAESPQIWDVAVIGAGMAGLICARRLQQAGYRVRVLDKSRGVGGRLATRRVNDSPVDHGCRRLEPTTPDLTTLVAELVDRGTLSAWRPQVFDLSATGTLTPRGVAEGWWAAPRGMSAVAKVLAAGIPLQKQAKAVALKPIPTGGWQIELEGADSIRARGAVIAIPAPQAADLVGSLVDLDWSTQLQRVTYAPAITVMAGYAAEHVPLPTPDARSPQGEPTPLQAGWAVIGQTGSPLAWASLDSSKGNGPPTVVLQSSAAFAVAHLETPNLTPAAHRLLADASPYLGKNLLNPHWLQVHRWRYALVEQPLGKILQTSLPSPLVCCGDWVSGASVGDALEAGWQAATAAAVGLKGNPGELASDLKKLL